ncbi:MAG: glycosyltransferase family 4 protein [Solirubrobacterales bacterium]
MKIVSVMTGVHRGGAEFAAGELLDALVGRGHEAVMLSDWPGIGRDTRIEVRPLELGPKLSTRSLATLALRWPLLRRRLREALEREAPYDVLLLHFKKEQLLAPSLPAALRPRVAWAEWGPVPRQLSHGPGGRLYAAAGREVVAVLAISAGTRDSVIAAGVDPDRVAVLPNALRTAKLGFRAPDRARVREELGIAADAFVVGCTSRFHPKKRLDVLVDAFAQLPGAPHLILAGAGETEDELRRRAAPLGERVHFLPTPGDDPAALFSSFDVVAFCPSPTEGSPTSVVLGMFAGRPCVSTAAEGVAGLVEEGMGKIASPENDPAAVAAALREYADDPERVSREGQRAAERARERFDADVVGAQAERLISA